MVMAEESIEKKPKKIKKKKDGLSSQFPPGLAPKMLNMLKTFEKLEEDLFPLINKPHHEVLAKLNPLEKSKIGMLEVYTINSLFWVLMKTSKEEVDPSLIEDYKREMLRLKEIQGRIAEVESREDRPQVNPEIASRLIRRGIGAPAEKRMSGDTTKKKKMKTENKPENCETESFKKAWQ